MKDCINPVKDLHDILLRIQKPARYTGGEYGIIKKQGSNLLNVVISYPDLYEIGMSNLAIKIIYNLLNSIKQVRCERVFAPAKDFESELRKKDIPLYSLESGIPLNKFDIIGFSIGYELLYTNILNILNLGGITINKKSRKKNEPIVLGGGPAATNPLPYSNFFDAIFIGEVEEWMPGVFRKLSYLKSQGANREDLHNFLIKDEAVWFAEKNKVVNRRIWLGFRGGSKVLQFPVPNIKTVQDHGVIEIMRGCGNRCRFCHAGFIYRPYREKSVQDIIQEAFNLINKCGYREITLSSLSTGDYSKIEQLIKALNECFKELGISFALPSLKINSFTLGILKEVSAVRKSSLTFSVESPLNDIQLAINKTVSYKKTIQIIRQAKMNGWRLIKLYFMLGLPGFIENDESEYIIQYLKNIKKEAQININVNISTFVPKPHTPFQWANQLSLREAELRILKIKQGLSNYKSIKIRYHSPFRSFLEGMVARGDKKVGEVFYSAFERGARFDSWEDQINTPIWNSVIAETDWDVENNIFRFRNQKKLLPWDLINMGFSRKHLLNEQNKVNKSKLTEKCNIHCKLHCGICKPNCKIKPAENKSSYNINNFIIMYNKQDTHKVLFSFCKLSTARYYSHLNIITILQRSLIRAGFIPIMTKGFNPKPKIEFANPLPLFVESLDDIAIVYLFNYSNEKEFINRLNTVLPEGLIVNKCKNLLNKNKSLMSLYWGSDFILKPIDKYLLFNTLEYIDKDFSIIHEQDSYIVRFCQTNHSGNIIKQCKKMFNLNNILEKISIKRKLTLSLDKSFKPISIYDHLQ